MRFPFETSIERGDEEIELRVIYDVTPFVPARLYGDYPQPAEGGEVEIISVTRAGKPFDLTDAEDDALLAECEERAQSDIEDEASAAADWLYQERRDRANDRWANLRPASPRENNANAKRRSDQTHNKGVSRIKSNGRWVASIHINNRKIHLGCFATKEAAADAYATAARDAFGEFARTA